MLDDAGLQPLREAARLSPDNLPLRQLLAGQLLAKGYLAEAEAEAEFRAALVLAPKDVNITMGLAEAFVRQSAPGTALAALEPFLVAPGYPPPMGVIAARALLAEGDLPAAAYRYHEAVSRDPSVGDAALAARLMTPPATPSAPAGTTPAPSAPAYTAPAPPTSPYTTPASSASPYKPATPPAAPAGTPAPYGTGGSHPAQPDGASAEVERSGTTFADVAGMEAVKEAQEGVRLAPDHWFPHYVAGHVHYRRRRADLALVALGEAEPAKAAADRSVGERGVGDAGGVDDPRPVLADQDVGGCEGPCTMPAWWSAASAVAVLTASRRRSACRPTCARDGPSTSSGPPSRKGTERNGKELHST